MLICSIVLIYTFCSSVSSKDITPKHQINARFSQPPIPLNSYPYQEDLTSSVHFLKEETSNKNGKVGSLIKLLKKVLTKYIDVIKENEENSIFEPNMFEVNDVHKEQKELIEKNNTIMEKKEQVLLKEFKNENKILKEMKTENILEEIYEIDSRMFDSLKLQNNDRFIINEPDEDIESAAISLKDFSEDDILNYMRHIRTKPTCYRNQQESYVLERPEPKMMVSIHPMQENTFKIDKNRRNRKTGKKNNQEKQFKNQRFHIPCVKASDILEDSPKYIPTEGHYNDYVQPQVITDVNNVQSTLESPVKNYITCSDSDDTVAMLFKPKTISLMQAYGNLLKKITVTVLVPLHVTKLVL